MHSVIESMFEKYHCASVDEYKNALKEIVQEITLLGLFRSNFFDNAAFYGGTALRIFYGMQRFSEDLDFSLLNKNKDFKLAPFCGYIRDELRSFGFEMDVVTKSKVAETAIESAFIKGNTLIHLLKITAINPPVSGVHTDELLKIKLEVDTDPPSGADYEVKYLLMPIPFHVRVFSPGSLFAGKVHAVLCRGWKNNRVKGRDLYDYVWYLSRKVSLNASHLKQRMIQTGQVSQDCTLDRGAIITMLKEKFKTIDFKQARTDVMPFIKNFAELQMWSAEFFIAITDQIIVENGGSI
ncbi:MAG TPA: nucleotidyl transferase AbiEii/AbiGii toxin family protein [Chitinispirillaceae bacterium]|nr:nucleotidyl transferase AbiEii/AbiGii toxin family protein [Chitinispirillaceae bacterium]